MVSGGTLARPSLSSGMACPPSTIVVEGAAPGAGASVIASPAARANSTAASIGL